MFVDYGAYVKPLMLKTWGSAPVALQYYKQKRKTKMYPEDQTPQMNSLGEPPQPATFGSQNREPEKKTSFNVKIVLWIGAGLLVLLLLIVGIVWAASVINKDDGGKKQEASSNTNTDEQSGDEGDVPAAADECTARERRYQNRDLSLGFCYPNEWGDVAVNEALFHPSDDGTRLRLSFADKPQIHIGLVSDDWSTDAARDGTCADPANQTLPNFDSFSARWTTEGPAGDITSATRGLEISTDEYIIEEYADNLLTNGACLTGFKLTDGEVYRHAEASYFAAFTKAIAGPQAHIDDPTILVPVADRTAFIDLVKSMYAY
jgi:hypothetical protein